MKRAFYERDEIIDFIFDYFGRDFIAKAERKDDYINRVQVRGSEKVRKIAPGEIIAEKFRIFK